MILEQSLPSERPQRLPGVKPRINFCSKKPLWALWPLFQGLVVGVWTLENAHMQWQMANTLCLYSTVTPGHWRNCALSFETTAQTDLRTFTSRDTTLHIPSLNGQNTPKLRLLARACAENGDCHDNVLCKKKWNKPHPPLSNTPVSTRTLHILLEAVKVGFSHHGLQLRELKEWQNIL